MDVSGREKLYGLLHFVKILRVDLHASTREQQKSCNYQGKMIIFT